MTGDWAVLHLDGDPVPGDPGQVRTLATRLLTDADRAERNTHRLAAINTGDDDLRMAGDYAAKYRQTLGELPAELAKLSHAYRDCGQALTTYAGSLEQAQHQAATALRHGRDADGSYQGALRQVQSLLPPDRHTAAAGLHPATLDAGTADLDPGLRAEIQAAAARGRAAQADRDRARRLAQDAANCAATPPPGAPAPSAPHWPGSRTNPGTTRPGTPSANRSAPGTTSSTCAAPSP
jgi:hypothetical protein